MKISGIHAGGSGQVVNEAQILWIAPPTWYDYVSPEIALTVVSLMRSRCAGRA